MNAWTGRGKLPRHFVFPLSNQCRLDLPLKSLKITFHVVNISKAPPLPPASLWPIPLLFIPPKGK